MFSKNLDSFAKSNSIVMKFSEVQDHLRSLHEVHPNRECKIARLKFPFLAMTEPWDVQKIHLMDCHKLMMFKVTLANSSRASIHRAGGWGRKTLETKQRQGDDHLVLQAQINYHRRYGMPAGC